MARTWTLVDTLSGATLAGGSGFDSHSLYLTVDEGSGAVIYSWEPVTGFTDISGSTFYSLTPSRIVNFKGDLYVVATSGTSVFTPYIYRYNSGTTWDLVWSGSVVNGSTRRAAELEADNNRIVFLLIYNTATEVYASTDGTTWTAQTANSGAFSASLAAQHLGGPSYKTATEVLIDDGDVWGHNSGNDWQKKNSGSITAGRLVGYVDGKSRFVASGQQRHSTDWGVTYTTSTNNAHSFTANVTFVQTLGLDIQAFQQFAQDDVYVYDPATDTWGFDGVPLINSNVGLLFDIGSTIYALLDDGTDTEIYGGGAITLPAAKFYQGPSLTYRSDLPFEGVNVGGLAVRDNGDVFAGADEAGSDLVARATNADSYATWTDLTGSLNTAKAIKGLTTI
jgi:hypothetical protein